MPTVADLIDYLQQLDNPAAAVVIDDEDFQGQGDYVNLRLALAQMESE
jgi:hypothetical protein